MKPHVLIVDDDLGIQITLREIFENSGFNTTLASSISEAEKRVKEDSFALMVLDIVLPDGSGLDFLKQVRQDQLTANVPVIVLSSRNEIKDRTRGLTHGANEYIEKPFKINDLISRAFALIGKADKPETIPRKILLASDDAKTRNTLGSQLGEEGFEVFLKESEEEILQLMAQQSIDCVLMDLNLSKTAAAFICRQIKNSMAWRHIPVIFLAANKRESVLEAFDAGADDYVMKSSDFEVLHARLLSQLHRKQIEDENRRIREAILRQEMAASKARSAEELAEARALLLIELGQKNAELEKAKEEALRESCYKTKFLASMSHELRTPLNAVLGFSELLEQEIYGTLTPHQKEHVQNILLSGRHLLSLVNDILDLSKIEAGRMNLSREWISFNIITDAVEQGIRTLADKKGVHFKISVPPNLPNIHVDPIRIRQILYNLLSNAVKFTSEGGSVELNAAIRDDSRLEITVEDTGIGIRPEDIKRLFREFERIEPQPGETHKAEGTGLGLVLTKRLVELHGGTVSLASEHGKGTKVTLHLPVLRGETFNKPYPQNDTGPSKSTILIVEDDIHAAELLSNHLRAVGLSVAFAKDAENAIRATHEVRPSAVILNILISGIDGWGLLSRVKSANATPSIPVLVTSVLDGPGHSRLVGASDYLKKPVAPETLWHALERVGVGLHRIADLKVLLADTGSSEMACIEEHLRLAGGEVHHVSLTSEHSVLTTSDLCILDLMGNQVEKKEKALVLLEKSGFSSPPPILAITDMATADIQGLPPTVETILWTDALHLDRFVRTVYQATRRKRALPGVETRTGLPSAQNLSAHLHDAIHRAERELKQILIVTARIEFPKIPTLGSWDELLHSRLRRSDYIAIVDDTLVLIVYGAALHESNPVAERFTYVLKQTLNLKVSNVHIFWYPTDGRKAEDLIQRLTGSVKANEDK